MTDRPRPTGDASGDEEPGPVAAAFGARLLAARKQAGLSLRELAEQLGVKTHANLSRAERGVSKPSRTLVERVEALTGVPLLESYDALEAEWQARARARAARRRELARLDAGDGTNPQSRRYPDAATAAEPREESAEGQEGEANRREAIMTLGGMLTVGAALTRKLLYWAESPSFGPLTLEEYDEDVVWLSEHATIRPVPELIDTANRKAAKVASLLWDGKHSGKQREHLELLIGQFAYLQGRFAFDLGQHGIARTHLRLAKHYGRALDHHLLLASTAMVESGIAFYQGHYAKSLDIAQSAQQYTTDHTAARFAAEEARAYGSLGPAFLNEMREALDRAEGMLPNRLVFEPGAESPFGIETFAFRRATASVRAGDERAEEYTRDAIQRFEELEAKRDSRFSFMDLALARLDLAMALLQSKPPEPREAARLGIQAVAVSGRLWTDPVKRRLNELLQMFWSKPAWRTLPAVRELAEAARGYRPPALPAPLPRRALGSA